jgi:hypothetical protein
MQKITIGDVAERIREPDEELLAVRGRLRFWVSQGIIKPEGDPKTPGRHRHFGESAIICAGILSRLSHHYKISYDSNPPMRQEFFLALEVAREVAREISAVPVGKRPNAYLVLWSEGDGKKLSVHCQKQFIDLKSRAPHAVAIPPQANDAISINLTKLFKRIRVPLAEYELYQQLDKQFG